MMTLRRALLTGTIISATALAGVAAAQTQPEPLPTQPETATVSDIVVTGSRIRLPDYVAPNPVQSVTSEDFDRSGQTNLTNFLTEIPALGNSLTLQDGADTSTPGLAGLNLLNLRNLGTSRTLVLVNGRRHVASNPGTAAVDVNSIPVALIERTEVLTGGASAVYGADGVSGVVNFILKDDFEGIDFRAQTGWSDEGGGENYFGTLVLGENFHDGRGNVTLAVEYNRDEALKFQDRSYTRPGNRFIFIPDPADPNRRILANDIRYIDTSPGGSVYTNFFTAPTQSGVTFLGDGSLFQDGEFAGGFTSIGGSGSRLDDFNDDLLPGLERGTIALNGRYDLTDRLRVFGELKYTNTQTEFTAQPSYVYGLFISEDNPFIPANVLADARTPGGFASTPTGGPVGESFGLPGAGVLLARDNFDFGRQQYDIERETYRSVIGLEGDLTDNLRFEVSYVYGRADQEQLASNVLINDRFFAATDVITSGGQPVCRSNIDPTAVPFGDVFGQFAFPSNAFGATFTPGANSGCLPLNLFGEGRNTQEALDWVMGEYASTARLEQHVVNAFISGDTTGMFELPAGPIGFVLGGEYRKESSDARPSDIELQADALEYPLTGVGRASRTQGSFDVTEIFAEVSVPVLRDMPFAQAVDLSAAYRYSDYSTSGGADTWNVSGRWAFDSTLALRSTVARAVRAPNVVNLFQGRQQTFSAFADPCSQLNLNLGENPTLRRQNCAADLALLGVDPTSYNDSSSESIAGFIQGNPALQPETANTYTIGFVATPVDIPGLSFSVDYYNIEIEDAIQAYAAQTIVNNCYDLPRPNEFCDLISRSSGGVNPGRINGFSQIPGNIASYKTSGWDINARYRLDPNDFGIQRDIGTFEFSAVVNLLDNLTFVEASGATPREDSNLEGAPRYSGSFDATWNWRALSVNYGFNYFNEVYRTSRVNRSSNPTLFAPEYRKLDARETHDVRVSYDISDDVNVFGGVNNFTNQRPGTGSESYPVNALGRYFFVGARMRLGALSSLNPF